MKGIRAYEVGGPDVLKYEDMPEPSAGPGEAIVAIRNIGVNYTDVSSRKGTNPPASFPWTPGREASGEVIAVGDGVTEVSVGDRVAYAMHTGSYAEQQAVPARLLVRIPDDMDFETGAATLLQCMTAHFLVNDIAPLQAGQSALVHAGAGGMGLLLIQMLKRMGLHVYTTVSTDEKAAMARGAGADDVILYTRRDFEEEVRRMTNGQGVKIIYDAVGRRHLRRACASWDGAGAWRSTGRPAARWEPWTPGCCATARCSSPAPRWATTRPHARNCCNAPRNACPGCSRARSSSTSA